MKNKIKCINVGWGEGSLHFEQCDNPKHQWQAKLIIEETKQISENNKITVYTGYTDATMVFQVEAGQGLSIIFNN